MSVLDLGSVGLLTILRRQDARVLTAVRAVTTSTGETVDEETEEEEVQEEEEVVDGGCCDDSNDATLV